MFPFPFLPFLSLYPSINHFAFFFSLILFQFPPILFYNPFSCYFYKIFFLFYCLPTPFVFLATFKRLNHFYFMLTARISISHWVSTWLQNWHQPHSLGCYYFLPNFHATPTHFQTLESSTEFHNSQNSSFGELLWILDISDVRGDF